MAPPEDGKKPAAGSHRPAGHEIKRLIDALADDPVLRAELVHKLKPPAPRQLVTLLQVAAACSLSKRSLQRYKHLSSFPKPINPDRRDKQAAIYYWHQIRSFLMAYTGKSYPEVFADLFEM